MNDIWLSEKDNISKVQNKKDDELVELDSEIKRVEDRLFSTDKDNLIKVYENKLEELVEKKHDLENKIHGNKEEKIDLQLLITNTKAILSSPLLVRASEDVKVKKMLLNVVFKDEIYFNKKSGIQTPHTPLIYKYFSTSSSCDSFSSGTEGFEPPMTVPKTVVLPLHHAPKYFLSFRVNEMNREIS